MWEFRDLVTRRKNPPRSRAVTSAVFGDNGLRRSDSREA